MSETTTGLLFDEAPAHAEAATPGERQPEIPFWRASVVVMTGIIATYLAQDKALGRIPVRNLLKNAMHLDRTQTAAFLFLIGFAWYLKPLFGAVIDAFPLFGSRRRSYMLVGTVLVIAGWTTVGFVPHAYTPLLVAMTLMNCAMVMVSCATGGLLVETAQASGAAGKMAGMRQTVQSVCSLISAPASGYLAGYALGWTALTCALVAASLIPVSLFFMRETYLPPRPLSALWVQLRAIAGARTMWLAALVSLLFYIAPGMETALFYKQQNDLHMTTQMQGWLDFCAYATMIGTSLFYLWLCRRLRLQTLLAIGIGGSAMTSLLYLFYDSVPQAFAIGVINGFGVAMAELAFLDLSARATPRGSESLGYALLVSVRNFALFGTDILGAQLLDKYGWHFTSLVWINSLTSLMALPLVFLLPGALRHARDG